MTSLRRGAAPDLAFPSKAIPQTAVYDISFPHSPDTVRQFRDTVSEFQETPLRGENSESSTRVSTRELTDANIGTFSPAHAGQMHLDRNYAREHWTQRGENPPVGLIVSSEQNRVVARYA